jgi:phosphopantothenoylcysteine decarboxylase/phosphopantothenate--cysteine ligase
MKKARLPRVLVTGGPTRAYLDRVRFLSNFSSGALAYELCRRLTRQGLEVALVSGPSAQPFEKLALDEWHAVETTREMRDAVMRTCREFRPDFAVFSAAVLDFEPTRLRAGKVSSGVKQWQLTLKPTPKIIDEVARRFPKIKRIGFKLEWERPSEKRVHALAEQTLREKGYEALCLNFLADISGKEHPAFLLSRDGDVARAANKAEIARWIAAHIRSARA